VTARITDCFKEYAILETSRDVRTTRHLLDYSSCQSFGASALPALTAGPEKFIDPQAPLFSMAAGEGEEESLSGGIDLPRPNLLNRSSGEQHDYRSEEPEEPTSPEQTKRTRPSRACDSCRKKKVGINISPRSH
jgi:hypothetical protein